MHMHPSYDEIVSLSIYIRLGGELNVGHWVICSSNPSFIGHEILLCASFVINDVFIISILTQETIGSEDRGPQSPTF